jgi:hypothetical protein
LFGNNKIINFTPLDDNAGIKLLKIPIKRENKKTINEELEYCGINESTLFPELDIQSDYVKKIWTRKGKN